KIKDRRNPTEGEGRHGHEAKGERSAEQAEQDTNHEPAGPQRVTKPMLWFIEVVSEGIGGPVKDDGADERGSEPEAGQQIAQPTRGAEAPQGGDTGAHPPPAPPP